MTEINTYSAAVDAVVKNTGRAEARTLENIKRFVRQSIRELVVLEFFYRDLFEEQVATLTKNFVWEKPSDFRIMQTVKYPAGRYPQEFPPRLTPGKIQRDQQFYYYGAQTYYVFIGTEVGDLVNLAYYKYPQSFVYYPVGLRPAIFDDTTRLWSFLEGSVYLDENSTTLTAEEQQAAKDLVSHWILFDWFDIVIEGGAAKTYKLLQDPRAVSSFALFKSFQADLRRAEPKETLSM